MVGEIKAVRPRGCFLASGPCLRSGESGMDRTKKSSLWKKNQHGGKAGFEKMGSPGPLPSSTQPASQTPWFSQKGTGVPGRRVRRRTSIPPSDATW